MFRVKYCRAPALWQELPSSMDKLFEARFEARDLRWSRRTTHSWASRLPGEQVKKTLTSLRLSYFPSSWGTALRIDKTYYALYNMGFLLWITQFCTRSVKCRYQSSECCICGWRRGRFCQHRLRLNTLATKLVQNSLFVFVSCMLELVCFLLMR